MALSGGLQGGSKTSGLTVRMAHLCAAEIGTLGKDRSPSYWTPQGGGSWIRRIGVQRRIRARGAELEATSIWMLFKAMVLCELTFCVQS